METNQRRNIARIIASTRKQPRGKEHFPSRPTKPPWWCSWLSRSAVIDKIVNRNVAGSIPARGSPFIFCLLGPQV